MLNLIKMDLYRMFRTKSLYVICIVLAAALLFTTILCKTDYEILNEADAVQQEQVAELTTENINVGMMVTLPTEPGEKVTVFDIFFGNSQGKFYALFLVIFAVLFSTADISSGYIKNIGGQVQSRGACQPVRCTFGRCCFQIEQFACFFLIVLHFFPHVVKHTAGKIVSFRICNIYSKKIKTAFVHTAKTNRIKVIVNFFLTTKFAKFRQISTFQLNLLIVPHIIQILSS